MESQKEDVSVAEERTVFREVALCHNEEDGVKTSVRNTTAEEGAEFPSSKSANHREVSSGKQQYPQSFIGREKQVQQLGEAFRRCTTRTKVNNTVDDGSGDEDGDIGWWRRQTHQPEKNVEFILITGVSGSGKTSLVHHGLRQMVEQDTDGYFISGKFDVPLQEKLDHQTEEYRAMRQALADLARQVQARISSADNDAFMDTSVEGKICEAIRVATETDKSVLDLAPELRKLILNTNDLLGANDNKSLEKPKSTLAVNHSGDHILDIAANYSTFQQDITQRTRAHERFNESVCGLLRAIVAAIDETDASSCPIVLFFDDLQWACEASVELLTSLVLANIEGLVVVGSCRSEEVEWDDPLSEKLRSMELQRRVRITDIQMGRLSREEFAELASGLLQDQTTVMSVNSREMLLEDVYENTRGNAFFAMEYLQFVTTATNEGGSQESGNIKSFHDMCDLFEAKIRVQASSLQTVLRFAASFGSEFDQQLLQLATEIHNLDSSLRLAEEQGFIASYEDQWSPSSRSDKKFSNSCTTWRFVHDKIHEGAYKMIGETEAERDAFHLHVGRTLLKSLPAEKISEHAFVIAGHFQGRLSLTTDPGERNLLSELFLIAGIKASTLSAFDAASHYLHEGIGLLGKRHWRDQYVLSLELYSSAVEVEFCVASDLTRMDDMIEEVRQNARTKLDMTRALTASVYALGSRNQPNEAIKLAFDVLKELGEPLPKRFGTVRGFLEFQKTKRMLKSLSDEEILDLPQMTDPSKLAATRILNLVFVYTIMARSEALPFVAMHLMQKTVKSGLSRMSSASVAAFAMLCGAIGEDEMAVRYGRLSLELLKRSKSKEWVSRVHFCVYTYCLPAASPWRDSIEPLLVGYQIGLAVGDVEAAFSCTVMYECIVMQCGCVPLEKVLLQCETFVKAAEDHQQTHNLQHSVTQIQFFMNLCGKSPDLKVLKGDACDIDEVRKTARANGNVANIEYTYLVELVLGCYVCDYEAMDRCLNQVSTHGGSNLFGFFGIELAFFSGLAATALYVKSYQRKHLRIAHISCKKLRTLLKKQTADNLVPRIRFLEAEIASATSRDLSDVTAKYDQAIALCCEEKLWNLQGLAHERAAFALKRLGFPRSNSMKPLHRARESYERWGATALVQRLDDIISRWQ